MAYSLEYTPNPQMPKLGWLAWVDQNARRVRVEHGLAVECRPEWMVEGIWDGDFTKGEFHQSQNFFGSGLRLVGDTVHFVTCSTSSDRLLYCPLDQGYIFSNSLVLLLAATGARLDSSHDYWMETLSIMKGVDKYVREFTIVHPSIACFYQIYYENVVVGPEGVSCYLVNRHDHIDSFETYHELLTGILERVKDNYRDPARRVPFSAFTMLSAGYDSTAASALARDLGVKKCFSGTPVRQPLPWLWPRGFLEDAGPIARGLGLAQEKLDSRRGSISRDELWFLATNYPHGHSGHWSELIFHSLASYVEKNCSAAVVYSGHFGDLIWDVHMKDKYLHPHIRRAAMTGQNITEIRLKSGFVHLAVPFILANNNRQVREVSRSAAMEPWRLHNDYDRPIPRRIAESAGVERGLFGMHKTFIAARALWPVNASLRREFFSWLKKEHGIGRAKVYLEYCTYLPMVQPLLRLAGFKRKKRGDYFFFGPEIDFYYFMTHWATHKLAGEMADHLGMRLPG